MQTMRETKYSNTLDPKFKRFLESEDMAVIPKQIMQRKAGPLVSTDIAMKAKLFK